MNEQEKEAYFCHTHTNLFSQKKCNECYRGMCYTCLNMDENICPSCRNYSYKQGDFYKNKRLVIGMLIIAGVILALVHAYQYNTNVYVYDNAAFIGVLGIVLFYTISVGFSYFLFEDTDILSEIRKVPFLGFKLMIATLIVTIIIGLPVFYFLNKVYLLLRVKYSRTQVK
ncbi:hypothetical protein [uncultured Dokdonia sp.]|uniref:hypothetical protein n=1 Tax=uncultured Dokdonia sp. TaxID=575653 RepID=UPI00260592F8|nr:hypothetical protein [uncultured Dokdonia sp.]